MAFDSAQDAIGREAAQAAACALDGAGLAAQMDAARSALRRACALGQADGGAARIGALAALNHASFAALGITPTQQQLAAALGMYLGHAVEFGYGAGRPLAVALCAVLQAWSGRHCHVACASDYLAARDAASFEPLFSLCECEVAVVAANTPAPDAARGYGRQVVYAGARQLLSDFMRDQMLQGGAPSQVRRQLHAAGPGRQPLMRGTCVAIVADLEAVMADDAASPVLLSAAGTLDVLQGATQAALAVVDGLEAGRDYLLVREPVWQVRFLAEGERRLAALAAGLPVYWQQPRRRDDLLVQAILARDALERERHYVVQDGRVMLADDSVYRMLAGRVWHQGMLQAVEAREGLPLSAPPRTVARAAFQTFFPRYERLSGAAASLDGLAPELRRSYGLRTVRLAQPAAAVPAQRYGYRSRADKLQGFVELVAQLHGAGTPVLAGAPRSADLAAIGRALAERSIAFQLVDGRDPLADAATLAAAALPHKVTLVAGSSARNAEQAQGAARPHGLLFEHWDMRRADLAFFAWAGEATAFAARDELALRALPLWAAPLRWLLRTERGAQFAAAAIVRLSQWHAARFTARHREAMAARENQLDEQLAFSKKG